MNTVRAIQRNIPACAFPDARAFSFVLGRNCFARRDPFDRSGFTNSHATTNFKGFRRFAPLDELVEQAAADAVRGAEIIDGLRLHIGSFHWKQKIPALTNQGRGGVPILQS
jgi:hypothetical protein